MWSRAFSVARNGVVQASHRPPAYLESRGDDTRTSRTHQGPGPFGCRLPHEYFRPLPRLRPVDQPELASSVNWLDSAGLPANGRGPDGPAREGRLSSQSPRRSRAVYASWTTSLLPCRTWCGRSCGLAITLEDDLAAAAGGSARKTHASGPGAPSDTRAETPAR